MANPDLIKNYVHEADTAPRRFVKFGSTDDYVTPAVDTTATIIGISDYIQKLAGERGDIIMADIAELELGGTVTRGDRLTADSIGRGVTAAPAAGVNANTGAIALMSGVVGDIINVVVDADLIQGA